MIGLLTLQVALSAALLVWSHARYGRIAADLYTRKSMRVIEECLLKIDQMKISIGQMSVQGSHAAACLAEMTRSASQVQRCTEEFVTEQTRHQNAQPS